MSEHRQTSGLISMDAPFSAEAFFSKRTGFETLYARFWITPAIISKFNEFEVNTIGAAAALSNGDLEKFGVTENKRDSLRRELGTLLCNTGPSRTPVTSVTGAGVHPPSFKRSRTAAGDRELVDGFTGANPVRDNDARVSSNGKRSAEQTLALFSSGNSTYSEHYTSNGGNGAGGYDREFHEKTAEVCQALDMIFVRRFIFQKKGSAKTGNVVQISASRVADRINLLLVTMTHDTILTMLQQNELFGATAFRDILRDRSDHRYCVSLYCIRVAHVCVCLIWELCKQSRFDAWYGGRQAHRHD